MESKTLSNKAVGSSGSDICFAPRERERDRKWGAILSGLRRKKLPTEVVQEAEIALVGIGIALLLSHALKTAFALNRSGDLAVAGRENAFLPECAFYRQQRSRVSRLPRTGNFSRLLFSDE